MSSYTWSKTKHTYSHTSIFPSIQARRKKIGRDWRESSHYEYENSQLTMSYHTHSCVYYLRYRHDYSIGDKVPIEKQKFTSLHITWLLHSVTSTSSFHFSWGVTLNCMVQLAHHKIRILASRQRNGKRAHLSSPEHISFIHSPART